MRAETAEYSMLKGRPVSPSLSSLMAFALSASLESPWGTRQGGDREMRSGAVSRTFWNLEKNLDMMEGEGRNGVEVGGTDGYK